MKGLVGDQPAVELGTEKCCDGVMAMIFIPYCAPVSWDVAQGGAVGLVSEL